MISDTNFPAEAICAEARNVIISIASVKENSILTTRRWAPFGLAVGRKNVKTKM